MITCKTKPRSSVFSEYNVSVTVRSLLHQADLVRKESREDLFPRRRLSHTQVPGLRSFAPRAVIATAWMSTRTLQNTKAANGLPKTLVQAVLAMLAFEYGHANDPTSR